MRELGVFLLICFCAWNIGKFEKSDYYELLPCENWTVSEGCR